MNEETNPDIGKNCLKYPRCIIKIVEMKYNSRRVHFFHKQEGRKNISPTARIEQDNVGHRGKRRKGRESEIIIVKNVVPDFIGRRQSGFVKALRRWLTVPKEEHFTHDSKSANEIFKSSYVFAPRMQKKVVLFLVLVMIFLLGCDSDNLSGSTVADVSTLRIFVKNETGHMVGKADVALNDNWKGTTREFGQEEGTKVVILQPGENTIFVQKEGYAFPNPVIISGDIAGEQQVVFNLEREKVYYTVVVNSLNKPVADALVTATNRKTKEQYFATTTMEGKANFERILDGLHSFKISKPGYETVSWRENISITQERLPVAIFQLRAIPKVHVIVLDEEGETVQRAEVSLYTKEQFNTPRAEPFKTALTEEGAADFEGLLRDRMYVITIKKEGYNALIHEFRAEEGEQALEAIVVRSSETLS